MIQNENPLIKPNNPNLSGFMKKQLTIALFLLCANALNAQIARWIIPPLYDSIGFAKGADLFITDSLGTKIYWDYNGRRLFATSETVHPFSEGYAVVTNESNFITGFYDTKGNFTPILEKERYAANDFPYFSDGYLIIKKGKYYIIDTQGAVDSKRFLLAYPFHNGFAVCQDYENPQKQKGTSNFLINKEKVEVPIFYKGRNIDPSDVEFISSVNDDHLSIVVLKKNLYYFNTESNDLSPLGIPHPNNNEKIIQAKLESPLPLQSDVINPVLYARCGRDIQVNVIFDKNLVPIEIDFNKEKHCYLHETTKAVDLQSPLQPTEENGLFGLSLNSTIILPPQFDSIVCCFNNYAFIKTSGKYGLLQNLDDATFTLSINKNEAIPFRHQVYETSLRIDMPPYLSPDKIDVDVEPNTGCLIDKISKNTTKTSNGNRADYSCKLTIPSAITTQLSEFDYPIQIIYDNIRLLKFQQKVKAWHYNYFDVNIKSDEIEIDKESGLLSFPYNINIERYSDKETFLIDVKLLPDTLDVEIQKISETRGLCKMYVSQLNEGLNYIFIRLIEQGCPPIDFPFAFTYTKPSPKTKQKPAVKENIQIKKKTMQELEYDLEFEGL